MFFQVERVAHESCKGKTQWAKVKWLMRLYRSNGLLNESEPSAGSHKQDLDTSIRGSWESLLCSS